jgi:hypothetical protein
MKKELQKKQKTILKDIEKELESEQFEYIKTVVKEKMKNIRRLKLALSKEEANLKNILSGKSEIKEEDYLNDC